MIFWADNSRVSTPGPYPLLLEPYLLEKIWGGSQLRKLGNDHLKELRPIGEAWILSSQEEHHSKILNGPLAGRDLSHAIAVWGDTLMGPGQAKEPFPLLLKLLEARENLSIQVHPSNEDLPGMGKEESWVVLKSDKGAVYRGLGPGVSKNELLAALKSSSPEELLQKEAVVAGEVLDIPAGTVHAILAGVLLFEVQQPSDVTYRLYDYGRDRPLHIEEAARVLGDKPPPPVFQAFSVGDLARGFKQKCLISKKPYSLDLIQAEESFVLEADPTVIQVLVNLDMGRGPAKLQWEGEELALAPGCALLQPAAGQGVRVHSEGRTFVLAKPGKD